jgi:hypothetical protein
VEAELAKYAAKIGEGEFVCFQKSLLRGVQISIVEGCSSRHAAHRKNLQLDPFSGQIGSTTRTNRSVLPRPRHNFVEHKSHTKPSAILRSCTYWRTVRSPQEARTVSSLNHPNICALYDVGNTMGPSSW